MRKVTVPAGNPYEVLIGKGLLSQCGERIRGVSGAGKAAIVTDAAVEKLYLQTVRASLEDAGMKTSVFSFPPGEESKSLATYCALLEFLVREKLSRSDLIVALGGGIPGDIAGFAAATYQRGIAFVQIPTTFLAAIDSSVGGKTAVNLSAGKNLAGAFYQPKLVLCDPSAFDTLPQEVFADGTAEAIKYGMLSTKTLFDRIRTGDFRGEIEEIIEECVSLKAKFVGEDEFDTGIRQLLNFGHTFGHAIEKCSGFSVSHGKAVGIGMLMAASAAAKLGFSDEDCTRELREALENNGLPTACGFDPEELADAMLSDKKRSGDTVSMIFPETIGRCTVRKIPVQQVRSILKAGMQ